MTAVAIFLPASFASAPPVLAAGAWFKNAVCGIKTGEARISRVVGDLNTPEACLGHEAETAAMLDWLEQPAVIAPRDASYPDYDARESST